MCSFAGRCQRSLGESQRAVSASVSAAASAGTRSASRLSIEGLSESEPKMGTAKWRRLQLFIMALSVVTGCWFLICCNRLVLRRPSEKEMEKLEAEASDSMADFGCAQKDMDSVATVSLSETEDDLDFDDGTDHEESDEALI